MKRQLSRTLAIACAATFAPAAQAQDRDYQTIWLVQPAPAPPERSLAGGEFVLRQRLLPTALAELTEPTAVGATTLPAGTQLIEARADAAAIFCAPTVAKQKLIGASFQPCLVDTERDGRFDGWFNALSQTKGLMTAAGRLPKKLKPIAAAYRAVAAETMRDEYFVAIERRNWFNIYSRESFTIAFGRDGELDRLTTPIQFKSTEMPKDLTVMGARFSAVSETGGKMLVRVEQAMPPQPFGIVKTTTYRFY